MNAPVVIHKDTNEVLGRKVRFMEFPQEIRNLFRPFIKNHDCIFFENGENYGFIMKSRGVIEE